QFQKLIYNQYYFVIPTTIRFLHYATPTQAPKTKQNNSEITF
ncbi:3809_t:CDS:1, partial [Dentiscutata heterogama]